MMNSTPLVLIVDDEPYNVDYLEQELEDFGVETISAMNGPDALDCAAASLPDLILLDIMMPQMDGFEVLTRLKANPDLQHIPVVIISAMTDISSVARGIQLGAEDYLPKPFEPALLNARMTNSLEKKRMRDAEQAYLHKIQLLLDQVQEEQQKSERLLLNILPASVAERLKQSPEVIADHFEDVSVVFADLVGFTDLASRMSPEALVHLLDEVFTEFDHLADQFGLEKIKTIGDAYMAVSGLPDPRTDHAQAAAGLALAMLDAINRLDVCSTNGIKIRIGIHSGPVVAGIIGRSKFAYDLWGDTVNTASRMESHGVTNRIHVSEATYALLQSDYHFEALGPIPIKGKGILSTHLLLVDLG